MDISLLEVEATISGDEFKALMEIMDKSELYMSKFTKEVQEAIAWCMIHAFEFGRIEERKMLIDELNSQLKELLEQERNFKIEL